MTICVLSYSSCWLVPAIDPAKRAAIEELLTLMKVDQQLKQVLPQIQQMMAQTMDKAVQNEMKGSQDPAQLSADLRDFQNRLFDFLKDKITFANMKPEYVRLYDETFTAEELTGILVFYRSPAGQAYLAKLPDLTAKTVELSQRMLTNLMPEMMKMNDAWVQELKKKYSGSGDK